MDFTFNYFRQIPFRISQRYFTGERIFKANCLQIIDKEWVSLTWEYLVIFFVEISGQRSTFSCLFCNWLFIFIKWLSNILIAVRDDWANLSFTLQTKIIRIRKHLPPLQESYSMKFIAFFNILLQHLILNFLRNQIKFLSHFYDLLIFHWTWYQSQFAQNFIPLIH